jgi:hypothetical protein
MLLQDFNKTWMKKGQVPVIKDLFYEFARSKDSPHVCFTIKPDDLHDLEHNQIYPSLHRLFVEFGDPTEYLFACHYFLNYAHWCDVRAHALVAPYLDQWRDELTMKIKADAILSIVKASKGESKDAITAARWLLQTDTWAQDARRTPRGRPSNKNKELSSTPLKNDLQIKDDLQRILESPSLVMRNN